MTVTRASTVARYLMGVRAKTTISAMSMHKLLYLSQGYSLAWRGSELFSDPIEAWPNGPVVASLSEFHRGSTTINLGDLPKTPNDSLDFHDKVIVNEINRAYGALTGWELRGLTMKHEPWFQNYSDSPAGDRGITKDEMKEFFKIISK